MTRYLAALILGLSLLTAQADPAHARSLSMARMEVDLRVSENGVLHVEERLDVRFTGSYNGIFRFLPYADLRFASLRRSIALRIDAVQDGEGHDLTYWTSRKHGNLVLKIRVPGARDAVRRVVIRYRALNVVLGYDAENSPFGGHDELYWNVVGTGWLFPIEKVAVNVTLPDSLKGLPADRFHSRAWHGRYAADRTGTRGALARDARGAFHGQMGRLRPGEAYTIALAFPPGYVDHPGFWMRAWWFLQVNWFLLLPLALLLAWFVLWWTKGRDALGKRTIIPEYEPPDGLEPSAVGVLLDERLDHRDVTAALIDLAVRGVLTITVKKGRRRLELHRDKMADAGLSAFDTRLIEGLFGKDKTRVALSSLKYEFVKDLSTLKGLAEHDLVARGYWRKGPRGVKAQWQILTVLVVGCACLLGFAFGMGYVLFTALCGVPMWILAGRMPRRSRKGLDALARVRGMQEYMMTAERERMKALPMGTFEKLLPFAIAFGIHDRWLKAFKDLFQQPPDWYATDASRFSWLALDRSISGMNRDVGRSLYSGPRPPKSSGGSGGWSGGSGFSGGGFSGGGFGGGGGGGW
jgi:uncharacterized membrane protein YgcG